MAEEEQKPADMSQESIDYENKREFRSDQSEGRLSLNDTLQSEYGSEGGQVSEGSSEQTRKRSRSRLSRWNKNSEDSCIEKNDNEKSIYTEEEFTDDIIDIPKEDRICSEKNKDLNVKEDSTSEATNPNKIGDSNQSIENDSNISHTIVDCPHALKVLTEDEPIVLEMKDTLKTQLEEVSSVLKAQMEKISDVLQIEKAHMEKISDELQIGALESNTLQDETLNPSLVSESNTSISLEDSTQYTEDKKYTVYKRFVSLPSFDESSLENGIQVVETNSNNVTQILNTSQNAVNESEVQNLSETVEFSITSDTQTSEALQILDKSGEVTSEAQNMNSIEVLRSIKDKVMQELDTFIEITSETQVQESLEKDVISDSTNIDSIEVMQVLDNSAEVTDIKNQVQISLEKDVISDLSSINLKKEMQVIDNSLEVDNEVQVPKPLEIAEISETLGKCISEPHIHNEEQTLDITDKVISKHDDIDHSECIIHVESSETVIDDLYSKLNTESMEDPHLKKKKSKLQSFDKQAGAKIHSFGESVGESGKDVINLVQKKVTQSTSKLKQRVSADISETTEIQRVNESDSLDNSGTDNVSTNLDTKKKQSKVHEWNKRAGAQIHALGESVDDAGRVIVKSLQKTRDVSTHREVKTTHNPVYEAESVVSVESSDLPQKEKGDNVVTEISTDKAVEVGKGEIQVDVSEVDAVQLEVTSKNKPSKLHNWDKQTGAQIHALSESIEGGGKEIIKKFRKSMILTTKAEENNHQEDAACITDNSKNITSDDEILQENLKDDTNDTVLESKSKENVEPSVKRKSTLDQWSKQAGARVHAMGETVGEGSHEALKKVQKGLSHSATLIKDKLPSVGSTQPSEDKLSSVESTQPSEDKLPSVESTQPSEEITAEPIIEIRKSTEKDNMSQKSSNVDNWNKRTGAQIYHMTENVGDRGRDVIKKVKRSVSRPRSMAVDVETEDAPAEENNVMNISMEGSVSSQKKKSGFKEWDKRTGAKIFKVTESVGDRGRDVIKSVRKNISRPVSVSEDMDANKDDQISTISKASETSQERKKKSKFSEWNKRTGAQVYHMTETTSKGVKTGINTAVHNPAVDKVRSGITAAANSPTVEAATERGRVLVRQATENLKRRTASMPRGASAPGTEGNLDYSSTLPRHRGGSSSPSRGGTLKRLSANLPPLPPQLRKVFPGRERAQYPRDPSPSKPSRRQGPVGRTWVKVYDDISYVDDKDKNREEDYPALANRMGPTVLPNAKPLPTPPTPPPPRARHQNPPAHDLAVDNEIASIDLEWQMETRGRNNNRFKGRREKRSSTPLGREYEDEGDALRRSARLDAPEGTDEDDYIIPENLKPEKPVRGIKVYEDVIFKRKQQDQEKNRQQEDELQEQKILEKQIIVNDEVKIEEPKKPQRGVKVYEDIIFKRQQEKEKQLVDEPKVYQEMEEQKQPEIISKDKEEVLLPVQKPQRGIKVYEGIIFKKQQETEKHIQEDKKSEETVKEVSAVEDKPPKPQRGIKVYDKIEFKNTQNTQYTFETNIDESVSEVTVDESSTSSEVTVIDGSLKEDVPFKPVRGNKIYASLLVKTHEASGQVLVSEVKETYREKPKLKTKEIEHTTVSSKPTPTEPVTPRLDELNLELQSSHLSLFEAPTLGVARMDTVMAYETPVEAQKLEKLIPVTPKVEAEPKLEETDKPKEKVKDKVNVTTKVEEVRKVEIVNKAGEAPIVEVTTKVIDMAEIGENIRKTNGIETVVTKPEENTDISDGSNPPYARVHKETGGVGPLRSLTPAEGYDEDGPAPPIPPKKVGIRTITPTASFDVPPRPDRHLKPTHLKPARGQKNRRPQINGEVLPSRPQRGNKLYADVEPAKPKRNSKVIRIEDVALLKDGLQELTMPPKPTRNLQRPNEAPPRRKRSGKENELVYEDVPDAVTARLTVALDHPAPLEISTDFYENIELKDGAPVHPDRSRMRGRPPPPPPPKKGKIQKNYQDRQPEQDSQPSGGGGSSSNGEVGKLGSGAVDQGGSSVSDSIVPPADVSSTTTAASAAITGGTTSQLETDIDHNLKNIESSFATLDDVLQSLKSYSRESSRNRRVILGESDKERAKLELEVNKRLEAIHSAEVVGVDYQNIEVKSGDVLIKKASVSENDYTEEKSQLIQLPDKIEVKPESNQIKSTETDQIKVAVSIEETQTVEKTQLLEKSNNIKADIYLPEKAVVKDVKNEETSEVKIAVSIEETQTVEKTQLLEKSNNIKSEAFAELKDVKDEETEEVKIAVTVQELQTEEKTSEVSSEVVKAHAEVKDVKDEEKEEVKVAVTVVELQTEGKTSEVKSEPEC